jgi:hypothetical protein
MTFDDVIVLDLPEQAYQNYRNPVKSLFMAKRENPGCELHVELDLLKVVKRVNLPLGIIALCGSPILVMGILYGQYVANKPAGLIEFIESLGSTAILCLIIFGATLLWGAFVVGIKLLDKDRAAKYEVKASITSSCIRACEVRKTCVLIHYEKGDRPYILEAECTSTADAAKLGEIIELRMNSRE